MTSPAPSPRMPRIVDGQHASGSAEWWTPPEIVAPARVIWPIDLDPASCAGANIQIGAARFFSLPDQDGLACPWAAGTVWCNPPSKRGEESAWEWWCKAALEWREGRAGRVLFQVFNPSSFFAIAQEKARARGLPTPQQAVRIEFAARIRYLRPAASIGLPGVAGAHAERGTAPPHGSALLLLPSSPVDVERFVEAYAHLGDALLPAVPARSA